MSWQPCPASAETTMNPMIWLKPIVAISETRPVYVHRRRFLLMALPVKLSGQRALQMVQQRM